MATKQTKSKKSTKAKSVRVVRPRSIQSSKEPDSAFFLKLVMYFIFGTLWIHIGKDDWIMPIPLGFLVGMAFATHDHFQIDRKIEYAVLVVAMFITYFLAPRLSIIL
jgi:hypothetical protein